MEKETIYLTFKTDRMTSWHLKNIAHLLGKSQPELINEICKKFISTVLSSENKEENNE